MKRLLISTLSILALSSFAAPAFANKAAEVSNKSVKQITPFRLVANSYQGGFKAQGIPAAGGLIRAVNTNRIDAKDLVKAGIKGGRLTEAALNDRGYLNSVDSLLDNLDSN